MDRRLFLKITNTVSISVGLYPIVSFLSVTENSDYERILISPYSFKNNKLVSDYKSSYFGFIFINILPGNPVIFKPDRELSNGNLTLRFSVAREIWDIKLLHVYIPEIDQYLGMIDFRFSSILVPYELKIDKKYVDQINKFGIKVVLDSPSPLSIIYKSENKHKENKAFLPHFYTSQKEKGTINDFLNCFISINSIQAFGWREGTVLDGLWQIYHIKKSKNALNAIHEHLEYYFDRNQNLIYESSRDVKKINDIDGIESTIPFATLARIYPNHSILKVVINGWEMLKSDSGLIFDRSMISAEGCYTVAYPMAVIGKLWEDESLKKNAILQLKHRFILFHNNQIYLRYYSDGRYTYPNWARGAAWTLLGFARTIAELKDEIEVKEVIDKFVEGINLVISLQRDDGLWGCFMHEKASLPDTSGSAGISASILIGINYGFLSSRYREYAVRCWAGLQDYITPDGFLKGIAQDNRGGIELQESDYRVISQMGMGLMAQLYAEL